MAQVDYHGQKLGVLLGGSGAPYVLEPIAGSGHVGRRVYLSQFGPGQRRANAGGAFDATTLQVDTAALVGRRSASGGGAEGKTRRGVGGTIPSPPPRPRVSHGASGRLSSPRTSPAPRSPSGLGRGWAESSDLESLEAGGAAGNVWTTAWDDAAAAGRDYKRRQAQLSPSPPPARRSSRTSLESPPRLTASARTRSRPVLDEMFAAADALAAHTMSPAAFSRDFDDSAHALKLVLMGEHGARYASHAARVLRAPSPRVEEVE
jgi:hypothetical protein